MKTAPLFAFWKYDTFPYCLGSEVVEMRPNGAVLTKDFPGMSFMPIKIVPLATGRKLKEALKTLEGERRAAINEVKDEYFAKLKELVPEVAQ
jgi:hypothetical protein